MAEEDECITRDNLLSACASACELAIVEFNKYQDRIKETIVTDGSHAASERSRITSKIGPGGTWEAQLIDRLTYRALSYIALCLQHIAALAVLLQHRPFGLPFGPLVRSIVEACGRSIWLLAPEIGLGPGTRKRVARLLLDEEEDARLRKRLAVQLEHPTASKAGQNHRLARNRISRPGHFYESEITSDDGGKITLRGESLPGPSEFVRLAERSLHADRDVADATYGYLSVMTHPTLFAAMETVERPPHANGTLLGLHEDPIFSSKLTIHGLQAFCDAWRLFASWTGSGLDEVEKLIAYVNRIHEAIEKLQSP